MNVQDLFGKLAARLGAVLKHRVWTSQERAAFAAWIEWVSRDHPDSDNDNYDPAA